VYGREQKSPFQPVEILTREPMTDSSNPNSNPNPNPNPPEDTLPARVYWAVGLLAIASIGFMYWLTAGYNIPLPPP
jgi:hypothetical protein